MKKKPVSVSLLTRRREITDRLKALAELIKTEEREMTKEEREEVNALRRERDYIDLETAASGCPPSSDRETPRSRYDFLREAKRGGVQVVWQLREEAATTPAATDPVQMTTEDIEPIEPLTVGEILKPIEEGLIWNKVGIRIPSGITGRAEWPVVDDSSEAEFAGELDEIADQKIDISKVAIARQRLGTGTSTSREAVFNSDNQLDSLIREILPRRGVRAINHVLFSPTKLDKSAIQGPFVGLTAKQLTKTGDTLFKQLLSVKAGLLGNGYSSERMCWVMTEETKAYLEATPLDPGSGRMTIEDGKLCGLPVYCSHYIGANNIGLGDWGYQILNQFGGVSFIFDPYTGAAKDEFKFRFNTYYGTATLRKDAFALCKMPA